MEKDWTKIPWCISVWNFSETIHIKAIMDFPLLSVYHISFCAYPRSAKLKSLRYMAKGAPYSNRKHCPWSAWNVSSIVQPLVKWHHITWSCFDANLMAGCRGDAAFLTAKANSLWMHFQKFAERNPWLNLIFDKFTQQYSDNLLMCVWLADQSEQTGPWRKLIKTKGECYRPRMRALLQ